MSLVSKKICLVGDFGVGKTSLIRRFVDRQFSDQYLSTLGVKISRKLVPIADEKNPEPQNLQLLIWDVEGRTKFQQIVPSYVQGAKGAIIVADLNRQETIEHITDHIDLLCSVNPKGIHFIVAFNKSDLVDTENMDKTLPIEPLQTHPQVAATYITSAKTGKNVDEIFHQLAQAMIR